MYRVNVGNALGITGYWKDEPGKTPGTMPDDALASKWVAHRSYPGTDKARQEPLEIL